MHISKWALAGLCLVMGVLALNVVGGSSEDHRVHAQQEVSLYNSRYIFVGDMEQPAIFDTATGVYRVWEPYPATVVKSYRFEDPKDVQVDTISYK